MTDRALVIGIDAYQDPKWELRAAVRDALAFAEWVTEPGAGRATRETLTLLLSPHRDRPVKGTKFDLATEATVRRALYDHKKNGAGAERLWFFYAGHGIAPAGGGPDEAPAVVPTDITDLDYYRSNPIELGSWIRDMQVRSPEHQVYFIDACRGIVASDDAVATTSKLFFDLSKVPPGAQARQAVLFATTAGQLANEQGLHGLFGGALIDGLRGKGPALEEDSGTMEFVLTFSGLAEYLKRRIERLSEQARRADKTLPTQEPTASLFRVESSPVLARFADKPLSVVKLFVDPEEAAKSGTAGIRRYNDAERRWERQQEKPLTVPIEWELPSTFHRIEIEARGFENWSEKVQVVGPTEWHADLVRKPKTLGSPRFDIQRRDLESMDDLLGGIPESRSSKSRGAELGTGKEGQLTVLAGDDRLARIEVFDGGGKRVGDTAWAGFDKALPTGPYRVEVTLPTGRTIVRQVLVTADEPEVIDARPDPQLTQLLPASAGTIRPYNGVSEPSEMFGVATTTHLGSLLSWAAWAAQFPQDSYGKRLRQLGVEPVPPLPGQCFVRLLVGDARPPGANPQDRVIEAVILDMNRRRVDPKPVPALKGFALQWHAQVQSDTNLTVQTGGLSPRRIPLPFIADHAWTIVIVRESGQLTEIHRYLQRLKPESEFDDTIRLVEQNWRALEARRPLYEGEAERLLARDLDPLSLAVLGYRFALEGRKHGIQDVVKRLGAAGLADVHVLASFLGERDENMKRAANNPSVPVVGEGYRLMEAWLVEFSAQNKMPPPLATEPFAGGLWTTFDTRQAVITKAFPVSNAPAWAKPLLPAANATARIELDFDKASDWPFIGTGFLIGPRALASTDFVAKEKPRFAVFDEKRVVIEEFIGATNDHRHGALARIAPAGHAPLKLDWALPKVGTRIAVIGHPMTTSTPSIATLAAFTTPPTGEKMIMPGVIVAVEPDKLTYECWTMPGTAGGPIVDLATGEVIGIHHSGNLGGETKLGFGVPVRAIEALLRTPIQGTGPRR